MDKRFDGKAIIVTGAGNGLGLAVALRVAREGARVALVDVNSRALEDASNAVLAKAPDSETISITADVSNEDQAKSYVEQTIQAFGRIDGLYNNAGIEGKQYPVEEYDAAMLDKVLDINLKGVLYGMKHTLPHLKAQRSGAIVNASSVGGIRAIPNLVAYVASKHAVAGMTKQTAVEYGQHGVSINAIAPGAIMTEMVKGSLIQIAGEDGWEEAGAQFVSVNPMRRFGEPKEVASLVAFLLSQEAPFINGAVVPIDVGNRRRTEPGHHRRSDASSAVRHLPQA
jgi:NAD(P)-dependent dehydrogenase (short-subunit alcohol dehydrogenase family)